MASVFNFSGDDKHMVFPCIRDLELGLRSVVLMSKHAFIKIFVNDIDFHNNPQC